MGVQAKICGITTPEAVTAALDGGAAYIGFMFFAKSPRNIAPDAAWRLAQPVRGRAKVVAVVVDPDDAELDRIAGALQPDLVQLHGKETPARARASGPRTGAVWQIVHLFESTSPVAVLCLPSWQRKQPGQLRWPMLSGYVFHDTFMSGKTVRS